MTTTTENNIVEQASIIGSRGEKIKTVEELIKHTASFALFITSNEHEACKELTNKICVMEDIYKLILDNTATDMNESYHLGYCMKTIRGALGLTNKGIIFHPLFVEEAKDFLEEYDTALLSDIADVFDELEVMDDYLVYSEKFLGGEAYKKISEFLKTFNLERTKYKKRVAYKNNGEFTIEQVVEIGKKLKGVSLSEKFDFYPTPKELVEKVQNYADIQDTDIILEPSAGTGALLEGLNSDNCYCVELNPVLCEILNTKGFSKVKNSSTEEIKLKEGKEFDKILMNPPFSKRLDAKHIVQVFEYLKKGGTLVAVHSAGITTATDKYSKAFQDLYNNYGITQEKIDSGAFKNSGKGTLVNTVITVLRKQ